MNQQHASALIMSFISDSIGFKRDVFIPYCKLGVDNWRSELEMYERLEKLLGIRGERRRINFQKGVFISKDQIADWT